MKEGIHVADYNFNLGTMKSLRGDYDLNVILTN
jgi:hypothetical protein